MSAPQREENHGSTTQANQPFSTPRLGAPYWFLMGGAALVCFDVTIVSAVLPDIVKDLGISLEDASLVSAITITLAGAPMVPTGKIGDLVGARAVLLAGLITLLGGNLAAGTATGLGMLLVGRLLQGAAFAMVITMVIAFLNRDYTQEPARTRAFALYFAVSIFVIGLAPLIGALTGEYVSWRVAFLIVVPLIVVVAVGTCRFVPVVPSTGSLRSLDFVGSILIVASLGMALFGVHHGNRYGWLWSREGMEFFGRPWTFMVSPTAILLGFGLVLLIAFMLFERWRTKRRLDVVLDTRLFRISGFVWGTVAIALSASAYYGVILVVSLYAEYILGVDKLKTGLMVAPLGIAAIFTGGIAARTSRFSRRTIGITSIGLQLMAVLSLVAAFHIEGLPLVIPAAMFVLGLTWIVGLAAISSLIMEVIPADESGQAAGAQATVRFVGSGLAMVIVTAIVIAVTSYQAQKLWFTGLIASDRKTLNAIERLSHPAVPKVVTNETSRADRREIRRYNKKLKQIQKDIDEGIDSAGLAIALMVLIGLIATIRIPHQRERITTPSERV